MQHEVVIIDALFPDLVARANTRQTAVALARAIAGQLMSQDELQLRLLRTFLRVVDGAILDYCLMREAYYRYMGEERLGSHEAPISSLLVPYFSHTENCISNTARALNYYDKVRTLGTKGGGKSLVEKAEWKSVATHEPTIRELRNAIQHGEDALIKALPGAARLEFADAGELIAGAERVRLVDLASTLEGLHDGAALALSRV